MRKLGTPRRIASKTNGHKASEDYSLDEVHSQYLNVFLEFCDSATGGEGEEGCAR
jgi:hypothetical protein